MLEKLKNFKWGYIIIALALAIIGVCFIAFQEALMALAITIGVILSVFAIVFGVITIASKNRGPNFAFRIFLAVMILVSGIVTAVFNDGAIEIMVAIFALLLIIDSSFKLHTSAMSKRYSVVGWWLMLVFSVLSMVPAFILLKFTPDNRHTCSILLGINFIINAVNNILSAFYITSFERGMEDEVYYERRAKERELEEKLEGLRHEAADVSTEESTEETTEESAAEQDAENCPEDK